MLTLIPDHKSRNILNKKVEAYSLISREDLSSFFKYNLAFVSAITYNNIYSYFVKCFFDNTCFISEVLGRQ
jgi:hypothetical protein